MRLAFALLLAASIAGCTDDAFDVLVDLRTDFAPGDEFDRVLVRLVDAGPSGSVGGEARRTAETSALADEDFLGGRRVAELGALSPGTYGVEVELRRGTDTVATRSIVLRVTEDVGLVVVVTRSCGTVSCPTADGPPGATTCVAGRCVDPRCVTGGDEACPAAECTTDSGCEPGPMGCSVGVCAEGFCLYGTMPVGGCGLDAGIGDDAGNDAAPVDAPMTPWLDGWIARKPIDFRAARVPADLNDYPAYVGLRADAELATAAAADGSDLRFTSADGVTVLPFEIERFDPVTGRLDAWVGISVLSSSVATRIYLYYGNPGAPPAVDPRGVWDADHAGVWHLTETPGTDPVFVDSTGGVDLSPSGGIGASARQDGLLGWAIDFDGMDDRLSAPADSRLATSTGVTVSAWVRPRSFPPNSGTIAARSTMEGSNFHDYFLRANSGDLNFGVHTGTSNGVTFGGWSTPDEWHFVAGTYDGTTLALWFDGVEVRSTSVSGSIRDTSRPFHIGSWGVADPTRTWDGLIDEVRVSTVARPSPWIATRFANESDPASFHAVAPEERVGP